MFCTNCGSQLKDGALFCGQCGAKQVVEPAPAPVVTPAPAPVVEAPQPVVETPVVEAPAPVVEQPAPVVEQPAPVVEQPAPVVEQPAPVVEQPAPVVETPAPVVAAPAQPQYQPQYQAPVYQEPVSPPPAKKKKSLAWLWIVLAVVLVAGIAVLALDFFGVVSIGIFGNRYAIPEQIVTYDADDNELDSLTVELNKKGLPEIITREDESGTIIIELEYGTKNLISMYATYEEEGEEIATVIIDFDKYGNPVYQSMEFAGEEQITEYEYLYDKKGNMLEKLTIEDGEEVSLSYWEYDKEGRTTLAGFEDYENKEYNYEQYFENVYKKGKLVERAAYDEDDNLLYVDYYEYDGKNVVYIETEYEDGSYVYTEYEYNKKGQLTLEVSYDEDGKETLAYEYGYDKNGNLEYVDTYYDGELYSYTEYSDYSNKIKLTDAQERVFALMDLIQIQK